MTSSLPAATAACQRCKTAKRRCDHGYPKCSGCTKGQAACVVVDPVTSKRYSRQYIADLQSEEKALLARLRDRDSERPLQQQNVEASSTRTPLTNASSTRPAEPRSARQLGDGSPSASSPAGTAEFVGDSSGLNLLRSMFSSREWTAHKEAILRQASHRPRMPELGMTASEAPFSEEAYALLNNYFSRFHIHHSFLVRDDVFATFDRVYNAADANACAAQDRFRLFMIFAISGVTRYRAALTSSHPYGYYLAALRCINSIPLVGSAEAIQNLLLIARFGMYYHVGISLWDISQSCMRQCIELGYHAKSLRLLTAFDEQKRRRIFWECYILDRYSSAMLGRPFAIADEDISTDLPVVANDETVRSTEMLVHVDTPSPQLPTELSVYVFCIRLRRISSRIRTDLYPVAKKHSDSQDSKKQIAAAGDAQSKVHHYLQELEQWRADAPVYANPGSLYERQEWYDFLLETDKLALLRAAMHASPRWRKNRPPPRLFHLNLQSAARAIELYTGMFHAGFITWTRNYFHTLFTAGISIINGLSFEVAEAEWYVPDSHRYWPALHSCANILGVFQRQMPDASMFAIIFSEALKQLSQKRPPEGSSRETLQDNSTLQISQLATGAGSVQPTSGGWSDPLDGLLSDQDLLPTMDFSDYGAFLSQDVLQSLEAGLGQYACGFPGDEALNFELPDMGL